MNQDDEIVNGFLGVVPTVCDQCLYEGCEGGCQPSEQPTQALQTHPRIRKPPERPQRSPLTWTGQFAVMRTVHDKQCRLGKNARLVAMAIGWHMGRSREATVGLPTLVAETPLCRTAVCLALREVCGPHGLFEKERRGQGNTNRYRLKADIRKLEHLDGRKLEHEIKRSGAG